MNGKAVLLYSGGMDSLIAWYYLDKPDTLYVDLGHRYACEEMGSMIHLEPTPAVFRSHYGEFFEEDAAHIPGRNLLLALYAASVGYDVIHLVTQAGEQGVPDRTPAFFALASSTLTYLYQRPIQLKNVFPQIYKHEMVKWYLAQGLPEWQLRFAYTCYTPVEGEECGQCAACFRKYIALAYNDVDLTGVFVNDVHEWGREHYLPRLHEYDLERQTAMAKVYGLDVDSLQIPEVPEMLK